MIETNRGDVLEKSCYGNHLRDRPKRAESEIPGAIALSLLFRILRSEPQAHTATKALLNAGRSSGSIRIPHEELAKIIREY
ncbi:hypothetical protein L6R21_21995 [bacterium]|nr:hypothetical protein [bacterium]